VEVEQVLEFDAAVKRFGPVNALDGCSFTARPGRLTGFLGPNGAGKTTAMRAVFGLVGLDSGLVRWCGAPVADADRSRFGYMPEERGLYPRMRVREQLLYLGELCGRSRREVGRTTDRWLDQLGIAPRATARVDELSHGNQQRVQLIAALVNEPDLLILDEPFAGLDPLAVVAMGGLLRELADTGVTVVFSSHQLDLVEDLCQDVVIVNHGRVVLGGELERLRAASPYRTVDIGFTGPQPAWHELEHVEVRECRDGSASLVVGCDVELRRLLAELDLTVEVTSLAYQPPTLSDLFTRAVSTASGDAEAGVAT
jgi:ABC-2 type transport system ATP-binding protein